MATETAIPAPPDGASRRAAAAIWAFAGGKGGVGRSFLAANLALQSARLGRRVVLIDADIDSPALRAFLGHAGTDPGLRRLLEDRGAGLEECLQPLPVGNLRFAGGLEGPVQGVASVLSRLQAGLAEIEADLVVLDLGSSRTPALQRLFRLADLGIVTVTPEPLSLMGAHGYLAQGLRAGPAAADAAGAGRRPVLGIVINQVRSEAETFTGLALRSGLRKLRGIPARILGSVPFDPAVQQALQRFRPLSLQYPQSAATRAIAVLLARLESLPAPEAGEAGPGSGPSSDHYETLEIPRDANPKRIQAAYEDLKRIYRSPSPFLPAAVDLRRLQEIRDQVEQAYRTLIFLETRREYDREVRAGTPPPPAGDCAGTAPAPSPGPGGPAPRVPPGGVSGAVLREIRLAGRVSLETVCEITKIRKVHIEAIEAERFEALPAGVFLRGFVRAYAQCLGLDPDRACRDYMVRHGEWAASETTPASPPEAN